MHTIFHFLLVYTDWQLVTSQDTVHRKYTSDVHLFSNIMGSPSLTENYMNAPWRNLCRVDKPKKIMMSITNIARQNL